MYLSPFLNFIIMFYSLSIFYISSSRLYRKRKGKNKANKMKKELSKEEL